MKLSNIRKVIAKQMVASLSTMAQLTLNASFDATAIMNFRAKLKAGGAAMGLNNITLNDIIVYAVSRTILNHPDLNAHLLEDKIRQFSDANLGVAVDTKRGLMVPTVTAANKKSLNELAGEVKTLAAECQEGTVNPDRLTGGSFTITNLGLSGHRILYPGHQSAPNGDFRRKQFTTESEARKRRGSALSGDGPVAYLRPQGSRRFSCR